MEIPKKGDIFVNVFDDSLRATVKSCEYDFTWKEQKVTYFTTDSIPSLELPLHLFLNMYEKISSEI